MAKGDRTGNRKTREQRITIKVPELGYYLIVTDTEGTERCFFTGLHQSLPEKVRNKLVIKVVETKTRKAIRIAQQKLEQCEREGKKKPSEMCPGTTVYRLVGEIRGKANG